MKACRYCKGSGLDPACDWDILEGEERCDPTHACPLCQLYEVDDLHSGMESVLNVPGPCEPPCSHASQ